jgi:hypothetical protein
MKKGWKGDFNILIMNQVKLKRGNSYLGEKAG